jgi:hypothetical protein
MASELALGGHPCGVQPEGNRWLSRDGSSCQPSGLGALAKVALRHEGLWLQELLPLLDAVDLCRMAAASRALYVYAQHDELWRALVLRAANAAAAAATNAPATAPSPPPLPFGATWQATFAAMAQTQTRARATTTASDGSVGPARSPYPPLRVAGFYSDLLFKAWYCATADISPSWLSVDNIPRRQVGQLTVADFQAQFERPNMPVILQGGMTDWPAAKLWDEAYLARQAGQARLDAGGFHFTLPEYLAYAHAVTDDQPLYLFDKSFASKVPQLGHDYTVPPYFQDDLLSVLGAARPDYRWLIVGPARSGSVFHKDPNATSAWNACITVRHRRRVRSPVRDATSPCCNGVGPRNGRSTWAPPVPRRRAQAWFACLPPPY